MTHAVGLETLLLGYREAHDRWMSGPRISTDPAEAFLGIFEALNWAVVVDDRLRGVVGRDWAISDPEGELVAGFRYARNTVHHDWSDALHLTDGFVLPSPIPAGLFEWRWRPRLAAKNPGGVTEYERLLADQPVRFTLKTLEEVYNRAASAMDLAAPA